MTQPKALMIFAAGRGTRMKHLTETRPKPLIHVAGKPLIDHQLEIANSAGIETILVNTSYLAEQLEAHLAPQGVLLSHETERLETGGGLKRAAPRLGEGPVFTLNSDAIWTGPNPLSTLAAAWDPDRMDALLLLIDPTRARGHSGAGDFVRDPDGRLTRGPGDVFTGAQIIKPDLVAADPDTVFSLNQVWTRIAATGRLYGTEHIGSWCDVGHPDGIEIAESLLRDPNV